MKESSRNRTEKSKFQRLLDEDTSLVIEMNRLSLMSFAKSLALVSSMGVLPIEVCAFCDEIVEFIEDKLKRELGFNDGFSQIKPDEFWAEFFPCPKGVNADERKEKILETFKRHRSDWRKLWIVD